MNIHHKAMVLVADGQKFLLLRNAGDFRKPVLVCEASGEQVNPATQHQGSDQPGRAFSSTGGMRSAMEQTDFHQLQKDRFADEVADILGKLAQSGDFDELIVVAPPRSLAELRKSFDRGTASKVVGEIDKDLTKHPVSEIAQILARE